MLTRPGKRATCRVSQVLRATPSKTYPWSRRSNSAAWSQPCHWVCIIMQRSELWVRAGQGWTFPRDSDSYPLSEVLTTTLQRPVFVFKRPFTSVPYLISPPASDFKHRLFVPHCTSQYRILYHHQHSTLNSDSLYLTVPHSTISYITTSTQHPTLNSDSLYLTVPHSTISYITTSTQHPTLNTDSLYLIGKWAKQCFM